MARARALTLSSGSHPPDFPDRKKNGEWRDGRKNGERKTRVDLQVGSCREKAGSLRHAATTTGLQKQTPHLLRWLLPRPTPRCHYVYLCGPSIHRHTHTHTRALRQAVRGSRAFERKGGYISGGSHLADAGDKARPYLPVLAKGVAYNDKTLYVSDRR